MVAGDENAEAGGGFPSTPWTDILKAGDLTREERLQRFSWLMDKYRPARRDASHRTAGRNRR